MRRYRLLLLIPLLGLAGCHSSTLPNPNDPLDGPLTTDNMLGQFDSISEGYQARWAKGQITDEQFHAALQKSAESLLRGFNPDKLDITKAWLVGSKLLINAKRWSQAKQVFAESVEWAKINHNEDRRVNDTLYLARVEAEMGNVPGALKLARSVFNTDPRNMPPILYHAHDKIAVAVRGKGADLELASFLEDAIHTAMNAQVDPKSEAGRAFLYTLPYRIRDAWETVADLYTDVHQPELAARARQQEGKMLSDPRFRNNVMGRKRA